MKWVRVYCKKVMDRTNFIDFIKESDSKDAEFHGWQRLPDEAEDEVSNPLILCS